MRYLGLLLWCFCLSASAQIVGVVKNESGAPVQGLSVTVKKADKGAVLAFARTDAGGEFKIKLPVSSDSLFLYLQSLLYKELKVYLSPEQHRYSLVLAPSDKTLEEVVVKPPLLRRNDTLSYQVAHFTQAGDRTLADMMGRIPGLEVASDGRVLYQGNAIEKYYIEGMDLLGAQYGLANNNLLADQVERIEVLEKHQSVRMLEGKMLTDRTSLNIRLKKKFTTTVPLALGGGLPVQGLAEFLPMVFSPRQQFIGGFKYNSTGKDIGADLQDHGTLVNLGPSSRTGILPVNKPPLSSDLYRFNSSFFGTVNALTKMKKGGNFRVNLGYNWDEVHLASFITTRFSFLEQNRVIQENNQVTVLQKKFQMGAEWSENTKDKYFSNALKVSFEQLEDSGTLLTGASLVQQKAENRIRQFSNVYRQMLLLGAQTVHLGITINYKNQPQFLEVTTDEYVFPFAPNLTALRQEVRDKAFTTEVSAATFRQWKGWRYTWTALATWKDQRLESNLLAYRNDLRWTEGRLGIKSTAGKERENWRFNVELPLYYVDFAFISARQWIAEPNGYLGFRPGRNWELIGSASRQYQFGDIGVIYPDYILTNYRILQNREAFLNQQIHNSLGVTAKFHNPFRYFNAWGMLKHTLIQRNALLSVVVPESGFQQFSAVPRSFAVGSTLLNAGMKYILPKIKVTVAALGDATFSRQHLMVNLEEAIYPLTRQSFKFRWNTVAWRGWSVEGEHGWIWHKTGKEGGAVQRVRQQQQGLQLRYTVAKRHSFLVKGQWVHFSTSRNGATFSDVLYRYKYKAIDIELAWQNVGNTRWFHQASVAEFSTVQQRTELRPFQVLLTARWTWSP